MSENPVTMRDVAAVAGVSVSTVSRTLKGTGRISPETRERVLAAAARLDFHPNALAQSFATGRSLTVGVLTQRASTTFANPVIIGLTQALSEHDIATIFYDDGGDASTRPSNLRKLRARRVDGVVVIGRGSDQIMPSIHRDFEVPVVYTFGVSDRTTDTVLLPADREAGRMAARHLIAQGRTRLQHITGSITSFAVRERAAGFAEVLDEAGLEPVAPAIYGDWTREWGLKASQQLNPATVDGVFCGNDFMALGVLRGLNSRNILVPDDVALLGYDNWAQFGRQRGFLTSIDPQLMHLGRMAGQRLVEATQGQQRPGLETTEVVLVEGHSTGAVPADDGEISNELWLSPLGETSVGIRPRR